MFKILMIDDEEAILFGYKKYLEKLGHSVETGTHLRDAENLLSSRQFDAIILDIRLPDGNGVDFIPELRKKYRDLIIIIVTALGEDRTFQKALDLGANSCLVKPVKIKTICDILDATLHAERIKLRESAAVA